jgi:Ala-tRNA(Pro) deacylase
MTDPAPTAGTPQSVFDRVKALLDHRGVEYTVLHHEPVYTSEQAAVVRGTPLSSGAKALVLKVDDHFVMCVIPADRKLDSKQLRAGLGVRNSRFANPDEVLTLTGLKPGSIPPFGSLFQLETYCDPALAQNERVNFNAGDHAISIALPYPEYLRVESPQLVTLTRCSD